MKPETRDVKEKLILLEHFGPRQVRCIGGHLVASGWSCPHCNSYEPSEYCEKEKIDKRPKEAPDGG